MMVYRFKCTVSRRVHLRKPKRVTFPLFEIASNPFITIEACRNMARADRRQGRT
jgi:hypothetical protein